MACESKVGYLDLGYPERVAGRKEGRVGGLEQQVLGLDVPVDDMFAPHELECTAQLEEEAAHNPRVETAASRVLEAADVSPEAVNGRLFVGSGGHEGTVGDDRGTEVVLVEDRVGLGA